MLPDPGPVSDCEGNERQRDGRHDLAELDLRDHRAHLAPEAENQALAALVRRFACRLAARRDDLVDRVGAFDADSVLGVALRSVSAFCARTPGVGSRLQRRYGSRHMAPLASASAWRTDRSRQNLRPDGYVTDSGPWRNTSSPSP